MEFHENFRAMDTDVDIFIETESTPFGAFAEARLRFEEQEQRFSRFRETSLLSRLNAGEPIDDDWFAAAIEMAIDAWETTDGLFNPMVLPALRTAGYDRTFKEVTGGQLGPQPVPSPRDALNVEGTRVTLNSGMVDLGGIVKGWTADIVAEGLEDRWPNVFVNAGGDIRCLGSDGGGEAWAMDVSGLSITERAWEGRVSGAIATSTVMKRRWWTPDGAEAHHLIDPRTGAPSRSGFLQVTARAEECWIAEVWAKAVLIGGESTQERAAEIGVATIAFGRNGHTRFRGDW
ncbi:MAG: FAD:protein FMN transferase [bacterium]